MTATQAVRGFVAGFLAILIFHQIALLLLHLAGLVPATPWNMAPVPPLGVPAVISAAFWGGLWGVVLVLLAPRLGGGGGHLGGGIPFRAGGVPPGALVGVPAVQGAAGGGRLLLAGGPHRPRGHTRP